MKKDYNYFHKCKKHTMPDDLCCECNYGKLYILCEYNHRNKCELDENTCKFKTEDRWLCEYFIERGTIERDISMPPSGRFQDD